MELHVFNCTSPFSFQTRISFSIWKKLHAEWSGEHCRSISNQAQSFFITKYFGNGDGTELRAEDADQRADPRRQLRKAAEISPEFGGNHRGAHTGDPGFVREVAVDPPMDWTWSSDYVLVSSGGCLWYPWVTAVSQWQATEGRIQSCCRGEEEVSIAVLTKFGLEMLNPDNWG